MFEFVSQFRPAPSMLEGKTARRAAIRFPFPSLAKRKPPQPHSLCQPRSAGPLPDVLRTSLLALEESARAFPPLKSPVAGVVPVWEIAERAKHCKSDACDIALRTQEILDVVAETVPDPLHHSCSTVLSDSWCTSVRSVHFFLTLSDIRVQRYHFHAAPNVIEKTDTNMTGGVSRVMHVNRDDDVLREINKRLDEAYQHSAPPL
ncbi:hypothetical protein B0H11DRAFT_2280606 [Mycena galericulata]|nr:hypothetical protein B0H11DRAFT_2280606 [Mycena galericulata]